MKEKQKIHEFIINIIDRYYPTVDLVLLAGSQLQPDYVRPQSDIDIVLIGKGFSGTTTEGIKEDGYSIDFTRLGYYNIQSILSDNSYDTKGTVIDMITHSQILKGDFNTYRSIRDKAMSLNRMVNQSFNIEYTKLRRRLNILKKHFKKDLGEEFYHFMIMDFSLVITSMHLLLYNNGFYPPDAFRSVKMMFADEENKEVLTRLKELTDIAFSNILEAKPLIINYIDKYLNHPIGNQILSNQDKRLIININYTSQSQTTFYINIYNAILSHPYLSKYYIYSLENSFQHIFKNRFSLVFTKELKGYNELLIIKNLSEELQKDNFIINELNIISPRFIYSIFGEDIIYNSLENIINYIVSNIINVICSEREVKQERFDLLIYTFANILARALNLSQENLQEITRSLVLKWRPLYLFDRLAAAKITNVNQQFMADLERYYDENNSLYCLIDKSIKDNSLDLGSIQILQLSNLCQQFAQCVQTCSITIEELDLKIMNREVYDEAAKIHHVFSGSMEIMMDALGIKKSNRSKLVYSLGRSYIK